MSSGVGIEQAIPVPPAPPQPHRSSFSCDRHPSEQFSGFCPLCLCERLTTLELSSAAASSSARPSSSSAAAALKSIFKTKQTPQQNQFQPELRRTQSFSASKNEGFSGVFEPQRHSCDVRGRSTLWSLFNIENENHRKSSASLIDQQPQIEEDEEEEDDDNDNVEIINEAKIIQNEDDIEIRACEEELTLTEEQIEVNEEEEEIKTIKQHIHGDSHSKKPPSSSGMDLKEIAGSFWSAASVFSKKWQRWRDNQKLKKRRQQSRRGEPTLPVEKPISRQFRETQSEIADYGFGRRSCDTEPARFSLDTARISSDDVRPSFEKPRASWDGYLSRSFARLPPILSAVEDHSPPAAVVVRSDMQIPVEQDEEVLGGLIQTREYYTDTSLKRKSLDRSSSIRKTAAAVVAEMDFHSNSMRDDCSETFELPCRDNGVPIGAAERKSLKKSRRWKNIWGLIIRRTKDEDEEERYSRVNGVERSFSESWQAFNMNLSRSNSSVNGRSSSINGGMFQNNGRLKRDEIGLERNRSARYSPNHIDNGLLRFYLTPMKGSCRRSGKNKANNSQSIARSVMRLY